MLFFLFHEFFFIFLSFFVLLFFSCVRLITHFIPIFTPHPGWKHKISWLKMFHNMGSNKFMLTLLQKNTVHIIYTSYRYTQDSHGNSQ